MNSQVYAETPPHDKISCISDYDGAEEIRCSRNFSKTFSIPDIPAGKKYHYFVSHKKMHSRCGNRSEAIAAIVHEILTAHSYTGFFDVDNLQEISTKSLAAAVRSSCVLIVVFSDETVLSEWSKLEWRIASDNGIPLICIADIE